MLGFSEEAQGWLPCKITTVMDDKWQIEWWDGSQADKIKDKTELHHFEEAGWWYRITEKALARKCHHCQNTDGSQGQWRTQDEWEMSAWRGQRENARCKECSEKGRPQHERPLPKGRGKMTRPQTRHNNEIVRKRAPQNSGTWATLPVPHAKRER